MQAKLVEFWNHYNGKTKQYTEGFKFKQDVDLSTEISLEAESIDIPFHGKTLRITVSEWGTVELLDTVVYSNPKNACTNINNLNTCNNTVKANRPKLFI